VPDPEEPLPPLHPVDLADVRGQRLACEALEVAAAGAHHLLMVGPPGCGKSMLARRLPTILPPLSFAEALEATAVHAAANLVDGSEGLLRERPFRAPHHSVTAAGLIGDRQLQPGEICLAHQGVLFLDEAPEFRRNVLEQLRQPLEEGEVRLRRAAGFARIPCRTTLVLAANPCPCGSSGRGCACPITDAQRYLRRLSGPLLDRVDLHLRLDAISPQTLLFGEPGEPSEVVRARVVAARRRQLERAQTLPNGHLPDREIHRVAQLTPAGRKTLAHAADAYGLSARATTRLLRVSRTLADLCGSEGTDDDHVHDALRWRAVVGA
jgi:magnesium chelatase family protein